MVAERALGEELLVDSSGYLSPSPRLVRTSLVALGVFPKPSSLRGLVGPGVFVQEEFVLALVMPCLPLSCHGAFAPAVLIAWQASAVLNGRFQLLLQLPTETPLDPQSEVSSSILTASASPLLWGPCLVLSVMVLAGSTTSAAEPTAWGVWLSPALTRAPVGRR